MNLLWTDFLNSEWHDWRGSGRSEDRLDNANWVRNFLNEWNLTAPLPPDNATRHSLKTLRSLLRNMVEGIVNEGKLPIDNLELLNVFLTKGPLVRKLTPGEKGRTTQITLVPLSDDWEHVLSEIAASFATTLSVGDVTRIRFCDNRDCLWIYYDTTRNRSKRFCDDKLCGNLMKVRRFRSKRKVPDELSSGDSKE